MSGSSSETDASLEDLPELKADLEEARQLISQLEDRKEETDPDRYEHVRQRYEQQIEELEPTVQKLTDQGESRKQDLEDRLATQQEQAEEAEAELREIEELHEEGAMDEEAYQEDRRRLQQQKNEAEKKASRLERELDEVKFYLTEKGEVSYQKEQLLDGLRRFRERLRNLFGPRKGLLELLFMWGGGATILLFGILYWTSGGFSSGFASDYPEARYRPPQHNLWLNEDVIRKKNSNKKKVYEGRGSGTLKIKWRYRPKNKESLVYSKKIDVYIEEFVRMREKKVIASYTSFRFSEKKVVSKVFKKKVNIINNGMEGGGEFTCDGNYSSDRTLPSGKCGEVEWDMGKKSVYISYESGPYKKNHIEMWAFDER